MANLWQQYADEFPVRLNCTFLNHAATAPIPVRTARAVARLAREMTEWGGTRWAHWYQGFERAHQAAAKLLDCDPSDVALVKNTTHGLLIAAQAIPFDEGDNVVVPSREFPANIYPWMRLENEGVELRLVRPTGRHVSAGDLIAACDGHTKAIAVSWVQFTDGYRIDLAALSDFTREKEIFLVVDAIQGLGAVPLSLREIEVDFLCADGHKWLLSPEGCAIFYVNPKISTLLEPANIGWHSMEDDHDFLRYEWRPKSSARQYEEGSPNMLGAHALASSVEMLLEIGISRVWEAIRALTDRLIDSLGRLGVEVLSNVRDEHRSGIVSFAVPGAEAEQIAEWMRERGIIVAARGGGVRVAPHFYNSPDDVDAFVAALQEFMASRR